MSDIWNYAARARSFLFVPGHRHDRFEKAAGSGADAIVLDLEDAVADDMKDEARDNVQRWLAADGTGVVRINAIDTPWYENDVAALSDRPCAVMFPKASTPHQVVGLM